MRGKKAAKIVMAVCQRKNMYFILCTQQCACVHVNEVMLNLWSSVNTVYISIYHVPID